MDTLLHGDKKLRPFEPGEYVKNPDGSVSTERSVTIQDADGTWMNVPSLWMGPKGPMDFGLDEDVIRDVVDYYERREKKKFPRFKSLDEAVLEAEARSMRGGALSGHLAR